MIFPTVAIKIVFRFAVAVAVFGEKFIRSSHCHGKSRPTSKFKIKDERGFLFMDEIIFPVS